jgi:hypothetical protein
MGGIMYHVVFIVEKPVWKQSVVYIVVNCNVPRVGYVAVVDALLNGADPGVENPGPVRPPSILYPQRLPIMLVITLVYIPKISPISRI